MKLLIIDDNDAVAEVLSELLLLQDGKNGQLGIEFVVMAGNLKDAKQALGGMLPGDAVICDGNFPAFSGGKPVPHWPEVAGLASKLGLRFVLHTGDGDMADYAHSRGHAALTKPAVTSQIYDALLYGRAQALAKAA
jgi:CheY-like chemotaxis protein